MKTIGIIAEFNPFHNGHAHLIAEAKKRTGADRVVAIMSGNYVQRGEPAFMDKYARAFAALHSGCDLVIELPVVYAVSGASYFALGAVKMLEKMNLVDYLCFGCETDHINLLSLIADIIITEDDCYASTLQSYLKNGFSFAKSRENAILKSIAIKGENVAAKTILDILNSPNAILAIEYLVALKKCNSKIVPIAIRRSDEGYLSNSLRNDYASAYAIRSLYAKSSVLTFLNIRETLAPLVPSDALEMMEKNFKMTYPVTISDFNALIGHSLLKNHFSDSRLALLFDASPDLANRIDNLATDFSDITQFINDCNSPTFTSSRIARILLYMLFQYTKEDYAVFKADDYVYYYRLLGFRKEHADLLSGIKNNSPFPLISRAAKADEILSKNGKKMFTINRYADALYRLVTMTKYGYPLPTEEESELIVLEK